MKPPFIPLPLEELSLYIHIPFCSHRCHYCHFYFEISRSPSMHRKTLEKILTEARFYRTSWEKQGSIPWIRTLYLGGGTPSLLEPHLLDWFLGELQKILWPGSKGPKEFTMEANPESLTPPLLEVLGKHRISRISLGVQSFQPHLLQTLGRAAGPRELHRALDHLHSPMAMPRDPTLSLDLIIGIPGQSLQDLEEDLLELERLQPQHISLYQLSIDEGTPMHQKVAAGKLRPMEAEKQEELWEMADQFLEQRGWINYEISNYARSPGAQSLHNLAYWQGRPYLGLGPGASGTISALNPETGETGLLRLVNPPLFDYEPPFSPALEMEWLGPRERFIERLITSLRIPQGIDWKLLDEFLPGKAREILAPWLRSLEKGEFWEPEAPSSQKRFFLNRKGRFLLDPLLVDLLEFLDRSSIF